MCYVGSIRLPVRQQNGGVFFRFLHRDESIFHYVVQPAIERPAHLQQDIELQGGALLLAQFGYCCKTHSGAMSKVLLSDAPVNQQFLKLFE